MRCGAGHSFDVARHGYVNLLPGDAHTGTGDTPEMVAARAKFLEAGHFEPLSHALGEESERAVPNGGPGPVVDLGAGTGFYLATVLERLPARVGLAADISKYALRRAARAHPRMGAVACDAWRLLPVRSNAVPLVLNVFAPRNGAEIRRVLGPEGALVIAVPTARHLEELVSALGLLSVDRLKQQRLDDELNPHFSRVRQATYEFSMSLKHEDIDAVVKMGPSSRHADAGSLAARVRALPEPMAVTAAVTISLYRPR